MAGKTFDPDEHECPVDLPAELTAKERARFKELDKVVRDGMLTFVDVGRALTAIKTEVLCREKYPNFKDYMRIEHEIDGSEGYRIMLASSIVGGLAEVEISTLPTSVWQCRELFKVDDAERVNVWQGVLDRAESEDVPVTSTLIRSYVKELNADEEMSTMVDIVPADVPGHWPGERFPVLCPTCRTFRQAGSGQRERRVAYRHVGREAMRAVHSGDEGKRGASYGE